MGQPSTDGFSTKGSKAKRPNPSNTMHMKATKSKTLRKTNRTKPMDIISPKASVKLRQSVSARKHPANINPSELIDRFNIEHEYEHSEQPVITDEIIPEEPLSNTEKKEHIINVALSQAKAPGLKHKRGFKAPKLTTLVTSTAAALLLIGYVTYLNIPDISLRVAASRAGIDAELPNYNPPGFDFDGPVAYSTGEISVKYQDSDNQSRSYSLIQKKSNWDSQSLQTNFVESESSNFDTIEQNGLTIYTIEDNTVTWVSGGIWYTINDNAELSQEQLIDIATSI